MGFFSNLIKKVGGFVASVFRDVEKPVKETEKTVKETAKVFEDTGLKAFRGFQKFIEAPIEVEEEPEEIFKELLLFRKIVKTTGYSFGKKETLYALTFEDNDINRFDELWNELKNEFESSHGLPVGYDSYEQYYAREETFGIEYPNIEVGTE